MDKRKSALLERLALHSIHHLAIMQSSLGRVVSDIKRMIDNNHHSHVYANSFKTIDTDLKKMVELRPHLFVENEMISRKARHDYLHLINSSKLNTIRLCEKMRDLDLAEINLTFVLEIEKTFDRMYRFVEETQFDGDSKETCFSLNEIIEGSAMQFRVQLNYHKIKLSIDGNSVNVMIYGKPMLLGYVYQAIIRNSIEALAECNQENKAISILTTFSDGIVTVVFSDNGPGIKKEYLVDVFRLGFSTKLNNMGFGLAFADEIVSTALDGKINILDHRPGTIVILTFKPNLCGN